MPAAVASAASASIWFVSLPVTSASTSGSSVLPATAAASSSVAHPVTGGRAGGRSPPGRLPAHRSRLPAVASSWQSSRA